MVHVTTQIVRSCHKCYVETGSIAILQTIEDIMLADDEATAVQIRSYLLQQSQRLLSLSMILRAWCELGWTYQGSAYCQLICQAKKEKRLEWAHAHLHEKKVKKINGERTAYLCLCCRGLLCWPQGRRHATRTLCAAGRT